MAMNKREQAEMADLRRQLAESLAMRFTADVPPDVPPPENFSELSRGWYPRVYIGHFGSLGVEFEAQRACSGPVSHSVGKDSKTTTQNPLPIYSSKLLALKAGRRQLELCCARMLAYADAEIAKEEAIAVDQQTKEVSP